MIGDSLYPYIRPLLFKLDPEVIHGLTLSALASGLFTLQKPKADDPILATSLWGQSFTNPIGLAAGFDKNGVAISAISRMGFGFVEIGGVTPLPQDGNPKPRLFRDAKHEAIINRMGLNGEGVDAVAARLKRIKTHRVPIAINLAKNKETLNPASDYEKLVRRLLPYADMFVINVSSPNTPGLRSLQGQGHLSEIVKRTQDARGESTVPILVKIAPDLTDRDKRDITSVATTQQIDGLVISNTTTARPEGLKADFAAQTGGLSGKPLFKLSTEILAEMYDYTSGRIPIIGGGGVSSAEDAYAKIRAGASMVQIYSALVYQGPAVVEHIKSGLAQRLREDDFSTLSEAVGADRKIRHTPYQSSMLCT